LIDSIHLLFNSNQILWRLFKGNRLCLRAKLLLNIELNNCLAFKSDFTNSSLNINVKMKNRFLILFLLFFSWLQFSNCYAQCTSQNVNVSKLELIQNGDNTFNIMITFTAFSGAKSIKLDFRVNPGGQFQNILACQNIQDPGPILNQPYLLAENVVLNNLPASKTNITLRTSFDTSSGGCSFPANSQCKDNTINLIILPVIWHNFSVRLSPAGKSTELNWSTLKEWESSHFEIERSINGIASYEKIGEEQSAGWSDTEVNYSFLDKNLPAEGSRLYYRIKQVDFDGTYDYSPTQMVEIPRIGLRTGWQAYPNPTQGQNLHIRSTFFIRKRENPIIIKMYSLDSSQCITFESFESEIDLSSYLQKFPKGLLIIEILSDQTLEILKVIHQ
jgi:hypothetical protein